MAREIGLSRGCTALVDDAGVIPWMSFGGVCFIWMADLTAERIRHIEAEALVMWEEGCWEYKNAREGRRASLRECLEAPPPAPTRPQE